MPDFLNQMSGAWTSLSVKQRTTMVTSFLVTVAAIAALAWWVRQPSWAVLYTGLDPKDAQTVVQELQARKIEHRLTDRGAIEVPVEAVKSLRMELAAKNLPGSGRFGFMEMFGSENLAQSDRTQRIKYQKALEDELARTIESIDEVQNARVHLVLPGDRVFIDDEDVAKASVTLTLKRAAVPTADEVRSIVHIVSGAVEGLAPERVSVVDTAGHTLWEGDGAAGGLISARQAELRKGVEKDIETKIARVLEPIVGPQHYVVRTTADMDFQKVLRKERTLDPDSGALISEQRSKDRSSSSSGASGIPGTASNLPGGEGPGADSGAENSQSDQVTNNYEYSVVERTVEEPVGDVKRLSVAVVLDYAAPAGAPAGGTGAGGAAGKPVPRSDEELQKIEQLVRAAMSFDSERGDVVTVRQAPFAQPELAPEPVFDWRALLPYVKYPALVLMLLLVFLLFFRPFVKTAREALAGGRQAIRPGSAAAVATAEIDTRMLGPASQVELLRQRLARAAAEQPAGMAQTLRVWLNEPKDQG